MKLPKENIERALKKASEKDSASFETGEYEIFGHGGVSILVTTLTDNSNRVNLTIKTYAKKADLKMASPGSILFKFSKKVWIM
jgi:transcriptional/translational regulatory protein YebC/TACO1